jgi:hypothetical protein
VSATIYWENCEWTAQNHAENSSFTFDAVAEADLSDCAISDKNGSVLCMVCADNTKSIVHSPQTPFEVR